MSKKIVVRTSVHVNSSKPTYSHVFEMPCCQKEVEERRWSEDER